MEVLRAFRAGLVDDGEAERIRAHLAACGDCQDLADDVGAFFDSEEPGEEETRVDKAGSWSRLEGSLAREGWFEARRAHPRGTAAWVFPAAAALVGLLLFGGVELVLGYGREATVLVAAGAYKGRPDEIVSVRLPVLLRLVPSTPGEAGRYRADLLDAHGSLLRSWEDLRVDRGGRLPLRLHRWQLKPGHYRLIVRADPQRPAVAPDQFAFGIQELRR